MCRFTICTKCESVRVEWGGGWGVGCVCGWDGVGGKPKKKRKKVGLQQSNLFEKS